MLLNCLKILSGIMVFAAFSASLWAVSPTIVVHDSQADFQVPPGLDTSENVAAFSGGELKLVPQVNERNFDIEAAKALTAIVAFEDGRVFVGSAPEAVVFEISADGKKSAVIADCDGVIVSDLVVRDGYLYIATAGSGCGVYRIKLDSWFGSKVETVFKSDKVGSIWAIAFKGDVLYIATGSDGKLLRKSVSGKIDPQQGDVVFAGEQKILRSMVIDGDKLYIGTGDDGLVYLIDISAKISDGEKLPSRVLLDADENEIVALAVSGDGTLMAAGSNLTSSTPRPPANVDTGRAAKPAAAKAGGDDKNAPATEDDAEAADDHKADSSDSDDASDEANPDADDSKASPEVNEDGGDDAPQPQSPPAQKAGKGKRESLRSVPGIAGGKRGENKLYMINTDGFVRVVGSVSRTVYDMAFTTAGSPMVYLACDGGGLHTIDPLAGISADIVRLDSKKPTALAAAADGRIYAASTAPAAVHVLSAAPAKKGVYVSGPIDADQISRWSAIRVRSTGAAQSVKISISTGNTAKPDESTWSKWSEPLPLSDSWLAVDVPAGRFARYRLQLDGSETQPVVDSVSLIHQGPNRRPQVKMIKAMESSNPQQPEPQPGEPLRYRMVLVQAADADEDELTYSYYYKMLDSTRWILWKDKVDSNKVVWDTLSVADGRYELRVDVCDSPSNPPTTALTEQRISRVVTVDNTAPQIMRIAMDAAAGRIAGSVSDSERIASISYRIDSSEDSVEIPAADGIFDMPDEAFDSAITDYEKLKSGEHVLTLTVTDSFGNSSHRVVTFSID